MTQNMTIGRPESDVNDTPVEEDKEAMLPEDGALLTFMVKTKQEQKETATAEIQVALTMEETEGDAGSPKLCPTKDGKTDEKLQKLRIADVLTQGYVGETSEKSQKSQVDSLIPTSSTSQQMVEEKLQQLQQKRLSRKILSR